MRFPGLGFFGKAALTGAAVGLGLFCLETRDILQAAGAVGLQVDVRGPMAALLAAVKPALPWLFGRIIALYLLTGAGFGVAAAALTQLASTRQGWRRWAIWAIELWVLAATLVALKAIERPALFDDLIWFKPALHILVDRGEPWMPQLAIGLWLAGHLAIGGARWGRAVVPWIRAGAIGLGALMLIAAITLAQPVSSHPLVVVIGVDAFRPDRLLAFGGSGRVAPHLEAFIHDATLFTQAYTPIAQTEPAWRSLLTARWPFRTGVRYPLTAESRWEAAPTFPASFDAAGFQTDFRTDCSRFNFQGPLSGFARREQPPRGAINFFLEKLRYRLVGAVADNAIGAMALPELVDNRALAGLHDPLGFASRLADAWVSEARAGPALVAYHATAAHFPGDPVYPYYRSFLPSDLPLERRLRMVFAPIGAGASAGSTGWTREGSEGLYDELLSQADAQVGLLIDALKTAGVYDEATIVVFSDHGESFHADRPDLSGATPVHGARLSQEENQILLAIKAPHSKGRGPTRIDALVRLIDLGPTLLDLSGLAPLPGADGQSLKPWLEGKSEPTPPLYAETGFTHASPEAFDPDHWPGTARSFDAYSVRTDGVVEMTEVAHEGSLREKDIGAFDGKRWVIRSPRKDGSIGRRCRGDCDAPALWQWLDALSPETRGPVSSEVRE